MNERDDEEWLDGLAGRRPPDSSTADSREAAWLRKALLDRGEPAIEAMAERDHGRERQLLERARREGLLPTTRSGTRWRGVSRTGVALAASLILVVAASLLLHDPSAPEVLRSADGVIRLESRDPVVLKTQIVAALRAEGVSVTGYERLGVQGIDADLPMPLPPGVRAVLLRHGIQAPADGVLRLEISAAGRGP